MRAIEEQRQLHTRLRLQVKVIGNGGKHNISFFFFIPCLEASLPHERTYFKSISSSSLPSSSFLFHPLLFSSILSDHLFFNHFLYLSTAYFLIFVIRHRWRVIFSPSQRKRNDSRQTKWVSERIHLKKCVHSWKDFALDFDQNLLTWLS